MDLNAYHASPREKERVASLMHMLPSGQGSVLDIGARDGFITRQLADRFAQVTALDLERPSIDHPRIQCVGANAADLPFPDAAFDMVTCAEVIEHIPSPALERACREMARVARRYVLVGVPYRQDLRHGRTTCAACGKLNPPWGHVNSFDEHRLQALFDSMQALQTEYIGVAEPGTNAASAWLMNMAGNPWGTYAQEEPCVHCGAQLIAPTSRTVPQRGFAWAGERIRTTVGSTRSRHANWIHMLLGKQAATK